MQKSNNPQTKKGPKGKDTAPTTDVVLSELSSFEQNLRKQIRNRNKKLDQIEELIQKIKKEKFEPNEAQKAKIAQKEPILAQIEEINEYLKAYTVDKEADGKKEKAKAAQHKKDIKNAKENTLKQVGELICLSTIGEQTKYRDMPEDLKGGLQYVSRQLQGVFGLGSDGQMRSQMDWKVECANFAKTFGKLANLQKDQIPDVGMSCEDLVKKATAQLQSLPDIVDFVVPELEQDVPGEQAAEEPEVEKPKAMPEDSKKSQEQPAEQSDKKPAKPRRERKPRTPKESTEQAPVASEAKEATEEEKKPQDSKPKRERQPRKPREPRGNGREYAAGNPKDASDEKKDEAPVDVEQVKVTVEEPKVADKKAEPKKSDDEGKDEEKKGEDGERLRSGKVRGERRGRGRGERGEYRGSFGEGRGEFRGRGRGGRGRGGFRNKDGEDEDGFAIVGERKQTRGRRGRGEYRGRGRGEDRGRGDRPARGSRDDNRPAKDAEADAKKDESNKLTEVLEPKQA